MKSPAWKSGTRSLAAVVALAFSASAGVAEDVIRIHLIWTNDVHGHVPRQEGTFLNPNFPPPIGAGASAANYIGAVRAAAERDPNAAVVLVDAGDTWQGDPVGTITEGRVMEAYYNALEYDVVIPGNHEFDKGKEVAIRMSGELNHPFVACNIYHEGTEDLVDWVEPYRIIERAGLRIGIIGANTPGTKHMAFQENIKGLDFAPLLPVVEKTRDHLYEVENVDAVFLVVHEGLPHPTVKDAVWNDIVERDAEGIDIRDDIRNAMDLAHVLERVQLLVGGHTHVGYREPWIDPVTHAMVVEAYARGSSVGHIILKFDRKTKILVGYESPRRDGVLVTLFEDEWWPDDEMAAALQPYVDEARRGLDEVVGTTRVALTRGTNSPMANLITDAMRDAVGADVAFTNNGGIRSDLSPGDITLGDIHTVMPFGNTLVSVQMDGRLLRRIVERKSGRRSSGISMSGIDIVVDPDAAHGSRVLEMRLGGEPVQPDRVYRVVTSNYLMEGNSGLEFLAQVPPEDQEYTQQLTRDAVQLWLEKHSPVSPKSDERWKQKPGGTMADYLKGWDRGPDVASPSETR
jgi:2',3'-cyclic-nucleotide 2'-phosphodiesterase (5'-nucleotidase family)